jgi:hypothetical protein
MFTGEELPPSGTGHSPKQLKAYSADEQVI